MMAMIVMCLLFVLFCLSCNMVDAGTLPDPFAMPPRLQRGTSVGGIVVEALGEVDGRRSASLACDAERGTVVAGEKFMGATVVQVLHDGVLLRTKEGKQCLLHLQ